MGINADFGIAPSSGAKDDRASVIAALMDSTAPATRMTPDAMANWRDMLSDLNAPSAGGGSRFGPIVGIPGVLLGLDRLDR